MTVDEIMASGTYTDRRGRYWENITHWGIESWQTGPYGKPDIRPDEMRLLIERDKHRDECEGLDRCYRHPVWIVAQGFHEDGYEAWEILRPYENQGRLLDATHAEAMDAAYTLAVDA